MPALRAIHTGSRAPSESPISLSIWREPFPAINMTYMGYPALYWRQRALGGDAASLEREIRASIEALMPLGVGVKVTSIDKLEDYEQPLVAKFEVKGSQLRTSLPPRETRYCRLF
jgi:hypothetical protein